MCDCDTFIGNPLVVITGFGPWDDHTVNASWEAVQVLKTDELAHKYGVEFVKLKVPVTYQFVDEHVPALWTAHRPRLMIHVGVSGQATCFDLESQAHRKGYHRADDFGECPARNLCSDDGALRIQTKLDVDRISKDFNDISPPEEKTKTQVSKDAGRFLCEYIYYKSLSIDSTRTLFVHVPALDVYSTEETARGLERILELCLEQVREREQLDLVASQMEQAALDDNRL